MLRRFGRRLAAMAARGGHVRSRCLRAGYVRSRPPIARVCTPPLGVCTPPSRVCTQFQVCWDLAQASDLRKRNSIRRIKLTTAYIPRGAVYIPSEPVYIPSEASVQTLCNCIHNQTQRLRPGAHTLRQHFLTQRLPLSARPALRAHSPRAHRAVRGMLFIKTIPKGNQWHTNSPSRSTPRS